jgi:hypothetical protein
MTIVANDENTFADGVSSWVTELRRLANAHDFVVLHDLFADGVQPGAVTLLLSALRREFVRRANDECAALVSPLRSATAQASSFPIHADLYEADHLLLVFNEVDARVGSGTTLLLTTNEYQRVLRASGVPEAVVERLLTLQQGNRAYDAFDEQMALLHVDEDWSRRAQAALTESAVRVDFARGDGVLFSDRAYLHGRAGGAVVTANRLLRLVFDSDSDRARSHEPGARHAATVSGQWAKAVSSAKARTAHGPQKSTEDSSGIVLAARDTASFHRVRFAGRPDGFTTCDGFHRSASSSTESMAPIAMKAR